MKHILITFSIALAGAIFANLIGVPSAWLIGSMFAVSIAAFCRVKVATPKPTIPAVSIFLGISVSVGISENFFSQIMLWAGPVVLFFIMLLTNLFILFLYYRRLPGWTPEEALFSATPGNLGVTMLLASEYKLNLRKIAIAHSLRLCFLVTLIPLFFPIAAQPWVDPDYSFIDVVHLTLVAVCGFGFGKVLERFNVPASLMIGAFISAVIAKFALGWVLTIPYALLVTVLVVLGANIGSRFNGIKPSEMLPEIKAGALGLLIMLSVTLVFSALSVWLFSLSYVQTLLGFAPGGMEVMLAIAMSMGGSPLYVATLHLLRTLAMSMIIPIILRLYFPNTAIK